ncbi:MAG: squalene--hopene cyclase [Planctomycetia bacterium]|nr:squalene--hopene cyclase [Planctomycetia bacterium]
MDGEDKIINAIRKTCDYFVREQQEDGHWVSELQGDALLQSETILLLAFLGEEKGELAARLARELLATQEADGGWAMYPGGTSDVTNTVKAYFALKLTGHEPGEPVMIRARERVLSLGGADKVNTFTRFYLALLGQIPYDKTPVVPPQMMFLPNWCPVNIYCMSSWSRTIFVPLSIVSALQPVRKLPVQRGIRELFRQSPRTWRLPQVPGASRSLPARLCSTAFRASDRIMHWARALGITPLRKSAIRKALAWTLAHNKNSDGPGAIYPPIVWAIIALKALGYENDSAEIAAFRRELDALLVPTADGKARVAPCKSPVWDTSLVLKSLLLAGMTRQSSVVRRGINWLARRQIRTPGDWAMRVEAVPGGWPFEYHNDFYPDCDDTAMAAMVLAGQFQDSADLPQLDPENGVPVELNKSEIAESARRGVDWLLKMQNSDGGWAAFDRNNNKQILCYVPFADHNAMIDPSTPDLTGRVLEALGRLGYKTGQGWLPVEKGIRYVLSQQRANGSWFGRWGINYLYGTWQALTGLTAVGVPNSHEAVQAGANWLLSCQQASGAWGETAESYAEESRAGQGPASATQTSWALMGLMAAGYAHSDAVRHGIEWLLRTQKDDGTWTDSMPTGTGFPQVFYLTYHNYSRYFPLMALAMYRGRYASDDCKIENVATADVKESAVSGTTLAFPAQQVFADAGSGAILSYRKTDAVPASRKPKRFHFRLLTGDADSERSIGTQEACLMTCGPDLRRTGDHWSEMAVPRRESDLRIFEECEPPVTLRLCTFSDAALNSPGNSDDFGLLIPFWPHMSTPLESV